MPGTLLVYDSAFPRAPNILSVPSVDELHSHHYPLPIQTCSISPSERSEGMGRSIVLHADLMERLDVLIFFGHGIVQNGVTYGIQISRDQLTESNLWVLDQIRSKFLEGARIELWVCAAASDRTTLSGRTSGQIFCQLMADRTGTQVVAAEGTQIFTTARQRNVVGTDFWLTETNFLPWEGPVHRFRPRR